jgi:hypothetical protein
MSARDLQLRTPDHINGPSPLLHKQHDRGCVRQVTRLEDTFHTDVHLKVTLLETLLDWLQDYRTADYQEN